jgi:hypothetical protein
MIEEASTSLRLHPIFQDRFARLIEEMITPTEIKNNSEGVK